jgi:hypothetical protein
MNKTNTIPLVASLLKKEFEIDDIQRRWKDSKHPINNPKGYGDPLDPKFKTTRLLHLDQLKEIINDDLKCKPEYYESGKLSNQDAFKKYINTRVKIPFLPSEQGVEKAKNVHWENHKNPYPPINNDSTEDDYHKFCELRFNKLLLLARVCNFIDQIQIEDYKKNKIVIDRKGGFISGEPENLVYGKKHSLSAYLGEHIVRLFPFKDYGGRRCHEEGFFSEEYGKQKRKGSEAVSVSVYEHFTPMSFFRDLIWFKGKGDDEAIFDWENLEHKAYTVEEWLSFLWYCYRTVRILKTEDHKLTKDGQKSRRGPGDIVYNKPEINIKIHGSMDKAWDEVHNIERLEKLIP